MRRKRKTEARKKRVRIISSGLFVILTLVITVVCFIFSSGTALVSSSKVIDEETDVSKDTPIPVVEESKTSTPHQDPQQQKPQGESAQAKKPAVPVSLLPEKNGLVWEVLADGNVAANYKRKTKIIFGNANDYSSISGVTCFRGNNFRNSASYGYADIREKKLEKVWFSKTGYIDIWTGVGWTGQPAIVKWDPELQNLMNLYPSKKADINLVEVIYATLDGKIYFLDLRDGKPTRKPIDTGYPHKGSVTIDPRGYPLLYAGQGIPERGGKQGPIGYRIYSLIDHKLLYFINGYDADAFRRWGAFDSGGLIDVNTDTLIECGENGLLYSVKLNTVFEREKANISIQPVVTKYRYRSPFGEKLGIENSPAIYKNYIYFADNSGLLQCVDLNTLSPVWVRNVNDDTDGSIVLEEVSDSEVYLYTACEVDKQGKNGFSYIRKINALTGEVIWEKAVACAYDSHTNGGALASPVLGKNSIQNLVIFNIAKTGKKNNGSKLAAFDKSSGNLVWSVDLQYYCWSSPVDIYSKDGVSYILVCDSGGYMRLLEGKSGKQLDYISLEANIEASPAVYENMAVVGTRGQKIWGIRIK